MRRQLPSVILLVLAACTTRSTSPAAATPIAEDSATASARRALITRERAFAARALDTGTRDAFLAYLADDAVLFVPRASPARPFFEAQPAVSKSRLEWEPIYAEVSRAGDLGFTTGPYEARANTAIDSVTAYGNFVSIWKRDASGNGWMLAVDLGTSNGRPPAARRLRAVRNGIVAGRTVSAEETGTGDTSGLGKPGLTPLGADSVFSARAAVEGTAESLAIAAPDVRVYREGREPVVGRSAASEVLRQMRERLAWHPAAGVEAQSADLGYTYGTYGGVAPGAVEEGAYVRIWRRGPDDRWRLALDITNPFPP